MDERVVGAHAPTATTLGRVRAALTDGNLRILALLFIAGQVIDAATTWAALRTGHYREANPFFADALSGESAGPYVAKGVLAALVLFGALAYVSRRRLRVVLAILAVISLQAPLTNALLLLLGHR